MDTGEGDLYIDGLSDYLRIPKETLYKYVRNGQIPARKQNGRWCFDRDEIDEWVEDHGNFPPHLPRFLIVDDEAQVRRIFSLWLKKLGYKVYEASDGELALDLLKKKEPIDLVFLDLKMPRKNGAETFREIRKLGLEPEVVIITAYYESDLMDQVLEFGPIKVLRKPVAMDDVSVVARLCEVKKARKLSRGLAAARA